MAQPTDGDLGTNNTFLEDIDRIRGTLGKNPGLSAYSATLRTFPGLSADLGAALGMAGLTVDNPEIASAVRRDLNQQSVLARSINNTLGRVTRPLTAGFYDAWELTVAQPTRMVTDVVQQYDRTGQIDLMDSYRAAGLPIGGESVKAVVQGESSIRQVLPFFGESLGGGIVAGNPQTLMEQPGAGTHLQNLLLQDVPFEEALRLTEEWVGTQYGAPVVNNAYEGADVVQIHVTYNGVDYKYGVSPGRLAYTPIGMLGLIQPRSVPANMISAPIDAAAQVFVDVADPAFFTITSLFKQARALRPALTNSVDQVASMHGGVEIMTTPRKVTDSPPVGRTVDGYVFSGGSTLDEGVDGLSNVGVTNDFERAILDAKQQEAQFPGTGRVHILDEKDLPYPVALHMDDIGDVESFIADEWIYPIDQLDGVPERLSGARTGVDNAVARVAEVERQISVDHPDYGEAMDEWGEYLEHPELWKSMTIDEAEAGVEYTTRIDNLNDEISKLEALLDEGNEISVARRGPGEVEPRMQEIKQEITELFDEIFDPAKRGVDAPPIESIHTGKSLEQVDDELVDMNRALDEMPEDLDPQPYIAEIESLEKYRDAMTWRGPAKFPGGQADTALTKLKDHGLSLTDEEFREAEELIQGLWFSQYGEGVDPGLEARNMARLEELIGELNARNVVAVDDLERTIGPLESDNVADVVPLRPEPTPTKPKITPEQQAAIERSVQSQARAADETNRLSAQGLVDEQEGQLAAVTEQLADLRKANTKRRAARVETLREWDAALKKIETQKTKTTDAQISRLEELEKELNDVAGFNDDIVARVLAGEEELKMLDELELETSMEDLNDMLTLNRQDVAKGSANVPDTGIPDREVDLRIRLERMDNELKEADAFGASDDLYDEAIRLQTEWRTLTGSDWVDTAHGYDPVYEAHVASRGEFDEVAEQVPQPVKDGDTGDPQAPWGDTPEVSEGTDTFGHMADRVFNELWMTYRQTISDFTDMGFEFTNLADAKKLHAQLTKTLTSKDINKILREHNIDPSKLLPRLEDFIENYPAAIQERTLRQGGRQVKATTEASWTSAQKANAALPRNDDSVVLFRNRPLNRSDYDKQVKSLNEQITHLRSPEGFREASPPKGRGYGSPSSEDHASQLEKVLEELEEAWTNGRVLSGPGADPIPILTGEAVNTRGMTRKQWDALDDDAFVEVFRISKTESIPKYLQEGIIGKQKPVAVGNDIRPEKGQVGEGLYVGGDPAVVEMYGYDPEGNSQFTNIKIVVRKRDVLIPPENPAASRPDPSGFDTLFTRTVGSVVYGDIPADNITVLSRTDVPQEGSIRHTAQQAEAAQQPTGTEYLRDNPQFQRPPERVAPTDQWGLYSDEEFDLIVNGDDASAGGIPAADWEERARDAYPSTYNIKDESHLINRIKWFKREEAQLQEVIDKWEAGLQQDIKEHGYSERQIKNRRKTWAQEQKQLDELAASRIEHEYRLDEFGGIEAEIAYREVKGTQQVPGQRVLGQGGYPDPATATTPATPVERPPTTESPLRLSEQNKAQRLELQSERTDITDTIVELKQELKDLNTTHASSEPAERVEIKASLEANLAAKEEQLVEVTESIKTFDADVQSTEQGARTSQRTAAQAAGTRSDTSEYAKVQKRLTDAVNRKDKAQMDMVVAKDELRKVQDEIRDDPDPSVDPENLEYAQEKVADTQREWDASIREHADAAVKEEYARSRKKETRRLQRRTNDPEGPMIEPPPDDGWIPPPESVKPATPMDTIDDLVAEVEVEDMIRMADENLEVATRQRIHEIRQEIYQTKNPSKAPEPRHRPLTPDEAKEAFLDVDVINAADEAASAEIAARGDLSRVQSELHGMEPRKRRSIEIHASDGDAEYVGAGYNLDVYNTISIEDAERMLEEGHLFPDGTERMDEAARFVDQKLGLVQSQGKLNVRSASEWMQNDGRGFIDWLNDLDVAEYIKYRTLRDIGIPPWDIQKMLHGVRQPEQISAASHVQKWVNGQRMTEIAHPATGPANPRAAFVQMASDARLTGSTRAPKVKAKAGDFGRRWVALSSTSRLDPWDFDVTFDTITNLGDTLGTAPHRIDEVLRAAWDANTHEAMTGIVVPMILSDYANAMVRRGYDPTEVIRQMERYYKKQRAIALYNSSAVGNPIAEADSVFKIENTTSGKMYLSFVDQPLTDAEISLSYIHVPSVREARRATSKGREIRNKMRGNMGPIMFDEVLAQEVADNLFSIWRNMQLARVGWMTSVIPDEGLRAIGSGHGEAFRNPVFIWNLVMQKTGGRMPNGEMLKEIAEAAGGLGVGMFGRGAGGDALDLALGPDSMFWTAMKPTNAQGVVTLDGANQIARNYASNYNSTLMNVIWEYEGDLDAAVEYLLRDRNSPLQDILNGGHSGGVPGETHRFTVLKKTEGLAEQARLLRINLEAIQGRMILLTGGDYVKRNPAFGIEGIEGQSMWLNSGENPIQLYDGLSPHLDVNGKPLVWSKRLLIEEIKKRDPKAVNLYSQDGHTVTIGDLRARLLEMDGYPDLSKISSRENYVRIKDSDPDLVNLMGSGKINREGIDVDPVRLRQEAQRRVMGQLSKDSGIPDGNRIYVVITRTVNGPDKARFFSSASMMKLQDDMESGWQGIRILDSERLNAEEFLRVQGYIGKGELDVTGEMGLIVNRQHALRQEEVSDEIQVLMDTFGIEDLEDIDMVVKQGQDMINEQLASEIARDEIYTATDVNALIEERIAFGERQLMHDEMTVEDFDELSYFMQNHAYSPDFPPPSRVKAPAGEGRSDGTLSNANEFMSEVLRLMGQVPSEVLIRNPYSAIRAWETAGDFYIYATPRLQNQIREAALEANISNTQFNRFVRRGLQNAGLKEMPPVPAAVQLTLEEVTEVMVARGIKDTRDLFFDLSKRGNWADALKLIFPFGDAWWEVVTRWGKIMNPVKADRAGQPFKNLRRMQQITMAGERSGWFDENERGERVFTIFPGPAMINAFLTDTPEGIIPSDEVQVGSLGFINFTDTRSLLGPGTGLQMQVGAAILRPLFDDFPAVANVIDTAIYGGFAPADLSDGWEEFLIPTYMKNIRDAVNRGDHDTLYASLQINYMNAAIAADPEKYATIGQDKTLELELWEEARTYAANYGFIEILTSFTHPTQAALVIEAVRMGDDTIIKPVAVADDFAFLSEHMGPEVARDTVLAMYGADPLNVLRKTYSVNSRPITKGTYDFIQSHPEGLDLLPYTISAFLPPETDGGFYGKEFDRQLDAGERVRLTGGQSVEILSYKKGLDQFAIVNEEYQNNLREIELRFGKDSQTYKDIKLNLQLWYNSSKYAIESQNFGYSGSGGPQGIPKRPAYEQLRDEMLLIGNRGTEQNKVAREMNYELATSLEKIADWWVDNDTMAVNLGHEAGWWYSGTAVGDNSAAALRSEFNTRTKRLIEEIEDPFLQNQLKWYVDYIVTPLMQGIDINTPFIVTVDPLLIPEG